MEEHRNETVYTESELFKEYLEPELVELGSVAEITFGNVSVNVG